MNIKKILVGSAAGAILLGSIAVSAFAVGSNGSFETGTDPGAFATVTAGQTNIDNWSVDSGSIDYIGTYWQSSDGVRDIDLNGLEKGKISQTITTVAGATYNVSFDMSGNPESSSDEQYSSPALKDVIVEATNGGSPTHYTYDTSLKGNTKEDMKWETMHYQFVATGTSSVLSFASDIAGAYGPAIDNVVIEEDLSTVPTPSPSVSPSPTVTPTPNPYAVPAECSGITNLGAPIIGTTGSNVINGTDGNDLIFALGGSDVVNGKGGNDCIVGGDGSDAIHGQGGNDVMLGGDGSDAINGGEGNDSLYGQDGSDALKGDSGNDQLWGGSGSDALKGDGGTDAADGGAGSDACSAETMAQCNP